MPLLQAMQQSDWVFLPLVFLFSLMVGSFLNVVIYRLPKMLELEWQRDYQAYFQPDQPAQTKGFNLAVPGSSCPHCEHPLAAKDNIPLLSYLSLKGRCRYCGVSISARYPLVELFTALLSVALAAHFGVTLTCLVYLVLSWGLIALTFIDLDKMLLPDQISQPLLWLMLLCAVAGWTIPVADALLGAVFGYLSLWSVYWLFKLATGKEGMGYGDFKLLALLGAGLGWALLPQIILFSALVGAVVGSMLLLVQGKDKATPIPFGPYIAAAGVIAMLWGEQINHWYLASLGL
ncbi:prepilin peptidase [Rheinheimera sp.]|uniref:prepilin peptidase n=1 Tax=Rheinheimera sp. TaxID=1869214 RepID=UPI00307EACD5